MKKIYFLFLSLFITVGAMAQMTITQDGNMVYFTYDSLVGTLQNNNGGDLDLAGETPNLYAWIDTADLEGGDPNYAVLGDWPGTAMTDLGDGAWSASVDLGTLYGAGVIINNINWIINGNNQQTADMLGTDYGFTSVTIQAMGVNNLQANVKSATIVGNDIYFNQGGNYQIMVYNANGKVINQFKVNANQGTVQSLNLGTKGVYFVQVMNQNQQVQNLKVLK